MKKWFGLLLAAASLLGLTACGGGAAAGQGGAEGSGADTVGVCVTFDAMREFAQAVGGGHVQVTVIIPDGVEPHDFEPKAQDLRALSAAQVFVYNGLGMESWVDDAVSAAGNADLVTVEASRGAEAITNEDEAEIAEHGQYDPHLWLSLKGAEMEAQNIRDGLIQADPDHAEDYRTNCDGFTAQLEALYQEYDKKFQSVDKRSIVTGHAAFAYLCRDFGLTQNSVEDVFAEGEPSAQQLAELVKYCRENQVGTIFAEELASPEVSQTLADEVGAQVKTIYTVESAEDAKSYLERMQDNLFEIYESLR